MVIAVLKNEENKVTDVFQAVKITLYEQEKEWEESQSIAIEKIQTQSLSMVRRFGEALANLLKTLHCNMLLGTEIIGIPFQILEKNEIIMCEVEDISTKILNTIYEDFFVLREEQEDIAVTPIRTEQDGFYYFDLAACQKRFPEITSKQTILPFLQKEIFICLTLQCKHVMPWLPRYASEHGLEILEEKVEEGCLLRIRHQECA